MSKLLTVVGATGTQGRSLIDQALKEGTYKIRGLTRDPGSETAKALIARGVVVVKADINDEQSLIKAFEGSTAIFAMTNFFEPFMVHGPEKAIEIEAQQGRNMARAASKTSTLEHYIWSTLPDSRKQTNGKYVVPHCEGKNNVDDFIRTDAALLAKTTFLWVTFYGNNIQFPVFTPNYLKTADAYVQFSPVPPSTPIKAIGVPQTNVGIFAHAILKHPELTRGPQGRFVLAHSEDTTAGKLLSDWSEVTGKCSKYVTTNLEDFANVWPGFGDEIGIMMAMWGELKDKSWSGEADVITREELGIDVGSLTTVKDAYKQMDWAALL